MFTKTDTYLQDDRGNRAYFDYFGNEAAAEEALKSLEYCDDCINCSRCSGCSDCSHVAYLYDKKDLQGDPSAASATLGAPPIPKIENIHQAVYAAASNPKALEMGLWHTCETTHCRASWVTHLAGEAGRDLENFHNTELAAMLIYRESSPIEVFPWRFYQGSDDALADMKRCAEEETAAE